MVTTLEKGKFILVGMIKGGVLRNKYVILEERELVAKLPDEEGVYDTTMGKLGMKFAVNNGKPEVIFDVTQAKALRVRDTRKEKRHKAERRVNISGGKGMTFLPYGKVLHVTTDAFNNKEVS